MDDRLVQGRVFEPSQLLFVMKFSFLSMHGRNENKEKEAGNSFA